MREIGRSFRTMWVIFKHEFSLYFISPIVYFIGSVWLLIAGFFFANSLSFFNQGFAEPTMAYTLSPMGFLMIFIAPALTMRLVSDEIRAGTHELLFTSPVRDWEIIVGKWLASWAVITIFILITLLYPALLVWRGSPDQGVILTGYLGLWLLSGATLAVGVLASSLTQYQLVAFIVGLAATLFLWLADSGSNLIMNPTIVEILTQIGTRTHFRDQLLSRGLIDPVDIVYFVGIMAISLFLATQILGTRRWRA